MKNDFMKQQATTAFQLYGLAGQPPNPSPEDCEDMEAYYDLHAVAVVISVLQDEGKVIVADALRQIYIQPFPGGIRRKRTIDERVTHFSMSRFVSVSSVYRYLRDARRLFVSVRYPGKFV